MSFNSDNARFASLKPSARKSIHSYSDQSTKTLEGMGRYGLSKKHAAASTSSMPDRDEVDNAFSKPLSDKNPSPIKYGNRVRRNSFTELNHHEILSEDNQLSKSLPPTFTSRYSNELADEGLLDISSHNLTSESSKNKTPQSVRSRRNESNNRSHSSRTPNRSNLSTQNEQSSNRGLGLCMIFGFVAILITAYYLNSGTNDSLMNYDVFHFSSDLSKLGHKYKVSDNSILQVQSAIASIFDEENAGSFIFAYNSKKNGFNKNKFQTFINDIASTASRYLRNDSSDVHHIVIEGGTLSMHTHSQLMNVYSDEVQKTGVLLVNELQNVPTKLAMAFHYYCDEFNPLVKKSAIFFTFNLGSCALYNSGQHISHDVIEKCLAIKWESLPEHSKSPLLTRVVDTVVDVTNVF